MSMSDKQARKMLLNTLETLSNIPEKQRDRIKATLKTKQQEDICLFMLLGAVDLITWDDWYELQAKRESEYQARLAIEQARKRDFSRQFSLCHAEAYHA